MIVCSRCGTQNPPEAGACLLCGKALSVADADPANEPEPSKLDFGRTLALPRSSASTAKPAFNPGQTVALPRLGHTVALPKPSTKTMVLGPGETGVQPPDETAELPSTESGTDPQNDAVTRPQNDIVTQPRAADQPTIPDLSEEEDDPTTLHLQSREPEAGPPEQPSRPESVQAARAPLLGQTLALPGMSPNAAPKASPVAEEPTAAPGNPNATPARPGMPAGLRSTVLGLGLPTAAEPLAQRAIAPQGKSGQTLALAPFGPKPATRTMLGIAPADLPKAGAQPPESDPMGLVDQTGHSPHTRTIMGVARPGIAPINPGMRKPEPAADGFPSPPPPPPYPRNSATPLSPVVPRDALRQEPGARTMTLRAARKSSFVAIAAIAAAVLLLAASAGVYFYLAGPEKIEARVVLDPEGRERILLRCPRCKDGTVVKLEGAETTFKGQQAELSVQHALKVGETPFTLAVRAPGSGRENTVALSVRIDYRVRADLSGLAEPVPRVRVLVDSIPESSVTVDDRPVALSATGQGTAEFDVSRELTGQDNTIRRLERRIGYAVVPPGGTRQTGEVIVQLGIAPLIVDAPGETITVETPTFVLAGRTLKGGSASVEGRALRVDAEGRFAQVMNISSVGETTITLRAVAPDHAPRLFPIKVRRVQSFAEEAAKVRAQATTSYASIADDLDKKRDWKIALDGSILERKNLEHSTLFLFEVTSGCRSAPCLARVTYGAQSELLPGDRVSVFGRVVGSVEGPRRNTKIPELLADFVLKAKK